MKKIISLLCSAAVILGLVQPVRAAEKTCPYCGRKDSEFIELTKDMDRFLVAGHYYLSGDVTRSKQLVLESEGVSCLDLKGHTLLGEGRALQIGEDAAKPDVVLNIFDSVGGGKVAGKGSTNSSWSAGTIYMEPASTINLYSGTLTTYDTSKQTAGKGGVATVNGSLNIYGGSVVGGKVGSYGGALWVQSGGTLKIAGGTVVSGTAPTAPCVYAHKDSKVILSGNGKVDHIAFVSTDADTLTVSGKYTGRAELSWDNLTSGTVIGISDNADLSGGILTVKNSKLTPMVSGNSIVAGEGSWCQACQKNVIWQDLSAGLTKTSSGHYRLTTDVASAAQLTMKNGVQICLDLNGYTYAGNDRTFVVGAGYSDGAGEVLNIMDSSADKTGRLTGCGGSSAMAGGIIYCYNKTFVNIYGGTLEAVGIGDVIAKNGGAVDIYGTVNMYGGTIIGNRVANNGGTVCLLSSTAVFNMEGGTLVSGKADNLGDCVYVASNGTVKLAGDAIVPEIYFAGSSASKLTVTGNYTGKATLKFATTPAVGADIGNCADATIGKESIAISGTRNFASVSGTNLVSTSLKGAVVDGVYCDTLAEALTKGTNIRLLADNAENITLSGDVTLDLNGWDLAGSVNAVNGTLFVKDSATDDHTVEDVAGYGKLTGTLSGNVAAAENYLKLTEKDGISFHHYVLKLTSVNLRPGKAGIYYKSDILTDEAVQKNIDRYGVTVSVNTATPTADPADSKSIYTAGANSVLITGILDGEATDGTDAATLVYGRPYILLSDGTYLYGTVYSTNLKALTEQIVAQKWDKLTLVQNRAVLAMYDTYQATMEGWSVKELQRSVAAAKAAANDGVFKAIILGNSDSTDATNLLYEIFLAEGWKKEELVLGCMYESGCAMSSHVKFALNDTPEYKYYKNTGSNADGSWDCRENTTLSYALQDENWDVVILQDSNTVSGLASTYEGSSLIETMITYVVNTVGYEPQLLWHFVGANPEIPEPYMSYVLNDGSADGDNSDASENEGWVDDGTTEPEDLVWIFDIARPSAPEAWAKRYYQYWNNDREIMYAAIAENVEKYILGSDLYGFDGVIPSATSFQHAINTWGMTEQDMYRDYTHKSDYGRVMVSYVWYATLTGQTELTQLQYTTVPAAMRQKKFVQYGDLVLTEHQIDVLLQCVNFALQSPLEAPVPAQ